MSPKAQLVAVARRPAPGARPMMVTGLAVALAVFLLGCGGADTPLFGWSDRDGDGVPDLSDGCPTDAEKVEPGACGCGVADLDVAPSDGVIDCLQSDDPVDADGDGTPDASDNCPSDHDPSQADADGDGWGDVCDECPGFDDGSDRDADGVPDGCDICPGSPDSVDADRDGIPSGCDGCPSDPEKTAPGACGCGVPDLDVAPADGIADCTQGDLDGDGVADAADNCPSASNPTQANADGDTAGDACDGCPTDPAKTSPGECGCGADDVDEDGDGVAACRDECPGFPDSLDGDGDGVPDGCDTCPGSPDSVDPDGDGVPSGCDGCPTDPAKTSPGECGCGVDDVDEDGDGVVACRDECPGFPDSLDGDGDGVPDGCDVCEGGDDTQDRDGDGVPDACDVCAEGSDLDADGDGIADACQGTVTYTLALEDETRAAFGSVVIDFDGDALRYGGVETVGAWRDYAIEAENERDVDGDGLGDRVLILVEAPCFTCDPGSCDDPDEVGGRPGPGDILAYRFEWSGERPSEGDCSSDAFSLVEIGSSSTQLGDCRNEALEPSMSCTAIVSD